MPAKSDYLEVNLYLEDFGDEDDGSVDVWVTCRDRTQLLFKGVRTNPVRLDGTWSISHKFLHLNATSYLDAADVWYFTVAYPYDNQRDDETADREPITLPDTEPLDATNEDNA